MKTFADLVVGDEIAIRGRYLNITTVERITKTQIITKSKSKFRRDNGFMIGEAWCNARIDLDADIPAIKENNRKMNAIKILTSTLNNGGFDYSKLDLAVLTEFISYLEGCKK